MSCVLCDGIQDNFSNIREYYNIRKEMVLCETESFKVIPDKFPIAPNHIIILPKKHINTFSELNSKAEKEVEDILNYLQEITKAKTSIMFEHGTSKSQEFSVPPEIKSIFHAHLHFIPNVKCSSRDLEMFFFNKNVTLQNQFGEQERISQYKTQYSGNANLIGFFKDNVLYEDKEKISVESYFYIKNSDETHLFIPERLVTPQIPSQFLREALSEVCDTLEWNWKLPMSLEGQMKYSSRIQQMIDLFKPRPVAVHKITTNQVPNIRSLINQKQRVNGD